MSAAGSMKLRGFSCALVCACGCEGKGVRMVVSTRLPELGNPPAQLGDSGSVQCHRWAFEPMGPRGPQRA